MNSLSLRVSSVKSCENTKKNAELRTSVMQMPSKYSVGEFLENASAKRFQNAKTVSEQLIAVKYIHEKCGNDETAVQFLADMYFAGPLKHPVRNQIAKLLQSTTSDFILQVLRVLNSSMIELLQSVNGDSPCHELNKVTTSLSGLFENFPIGLQTLRQNVEAVFPLLIESLQKYMMETSLQSSPSAKNELYLFIHNSIRFTLACIQEFVDILAQDANNFINNFKIPAHDLIFDADIPMDIKTNCGHLIAFIAKINDQYAEHVSNVATKDLEAENNCLVLCISIGVINTLNLKVLQSFKEDVKSIVSNIYIIGNKYSTEPSMLLGATRILFQLSKLLLSFSVSDLDHDVVKSIIQKLTQYGLCYFEHHIDSVRHICKDLIRTIIKLNCNFGFDDLLNEIFGFCVQDDTAQSLKYGILIAVSNTIGTEILLKKFPTLLHDLVSNGLGNDLTIANCYENLMIAHRKEIKFEKWKDFWIMPLLRLGRNDTNLLGTIEILINKAIKCEPAIIDILVDIDDKDIPLSIRLSALWTLRKHGLKAVNFQSILASFANVLRDTMVSNNDDTKIMALRLVVESHKTTELFTEIECETILEFLQWNSNCQSPAIRQRSLALVAKGLVRFKLNFESSLKDNNGRYAYYRNFLKRLIKLLNRNLFPGANFSRRFVSLTLLEQSLDIVIACGENIDEYLPENSIPKLVIVLNDSYEGNKAIAVSILQLVTKDNQHQISLDTINCLMTSVRPIDSSTSAYYLEYHCLCPRAFELCKFEVAANKHPMQFQAILWCMQILENGLACAQSSILLAARKNPLYGSVFTIQHLLSKIDFSQLTEEVWRRIFTKLIGLCKALDQVVGPVVNSSSPEGHLPNDFSEIPEYLRGGHDDEEENKGYCKILTNKVDMQLELLKTTPQMVLLCAWRTVKEVSLLLGEIVLRSPIKPRSDNTSDYLITIDQIMEIGEHFKELLSETKHRGAFEQAYIGFSKVCTRLWRTEHSELYKLPMTWLNDLIYIISKDEKINEKICATRRSAGVPFMVQALITSELQVGTTKALTYCMRHLISLCSDSNKSTESRTHALNILRALFRCSDLNEAVGEYVAEGVMCAIRGYAANTWAERNSSTLLFSALITRIFGVQRTKEWDSLTLRNRMTGRIFFLRYPQLYDFFLVELQEASCCIQRNEKPAKLHPLLLILSRLYPSALEGTESNLKLSSFIDHVSICSGSAEMITRVLSAKAIVAFITLDIIESRILKVFECIQEHLRTGKANPNYVHGLLLQVFYMLKSHKTLPSKHFVAIIKCITSLWPNLMDNPVRSKISLEIMLEILKQPNFAPALTGECLHFVSLSDYVQVFNHHFSSMYPVFRKSLLLFNLHLLKSTSPEALLQFFNTCFQTMLSLTYEEIETCLNIVLLILFDSSDPELTSVYDCSEFETSFANTLDKKLSQMLREDFKSNDCLKKCLNRICVERRFYPECTIKGYAILSQLSTVDIVLKEFIANAKQMPDDVKDSMAKCLESYVKGRTLVDSELNETLTFLEDLLLPWNSDLLRLTAAKIVRLVALVVFERVDILTLNSLIKLVNIMLCLSRDDDSDVRDHICKSIVMLSNMRTDNIAASYAPIILTKYLSGILKQTANLEFTKRVIAGILSVQNDEVQSTKRDADADNRDVFDKNEANVYAEPYKTLEDCIETFKECFQSDEKLLLFINGMVGKYIVK